MSSNRNREKRNASARKYYQAHRDECMKRSKAYHDAHQDELKEYARNYRKGYHATHKEEINEYSRKYNRTLEGKYSNLEKSARQRNLEVSLTFEEFCSIVEKPCFYCNQLLPEAGYGTDRIDSDLGYTFENCRPCCTQCNKAKNVKSEQEFREWIERVYHNWVEVKA